MYVKTNSKRFDYIPNGVYNEVITYSIRYLKKEVIDTVTGFLILFIFAVIIHAIYVRMIPVRGLRCIYDYNTLDTKNILLLDLRDYNEATKVPVSDAYNLPIVYLKRYHSTIQRRNVILIASDLLTINMGARFLKRKGFNVIGYSLTECDSMSYIRTCCAKRGTLHGI